MLWSVVTWPFRLIGSGVELLGRFVGVVVGFALMVLGVAMCSGMLYPIGVPVFVIGLILMLRSFG